MQFTSVLEKFEGNLWGHHILVPDGIYQPYAATDRRVVCRINDLKEFQCALMSKGDGQYFINLNKKLRKKLDINIGEAVTVELRKDESEYGLPMPEEMQELLNLDDEGNHYFHQLTKGKQRTLLHLVGKPKNTDIRLRKAVAVLEYLKEVEGKLDFKELNIAIKESNQR
ncbi:MAG: bifunctional DNA-binding transcriptional regulator [Saprospiraceae bacterium]|jgi:bifunctional DNA-binding transcriptional regulator/antitoxin component of YhaV-PrlF toxin-antitoxin module